MNQKDLAKQLNLSRTTVSRCFTNHPKINPETRARVFELAAKHGYSYSPPRNQTSQRPSKASQVAVLVGKPSIAGEWFSTERDVLAGISARLATEKLTLNVQYVDPAEFDLAPRARRILPGIRNSEVVGFILVYPIKEATVRNIITKFPTVCALDDYENLQVDCVDVNQTRGISGIVDRLHELGHRELAFVSRKYTVITPWVEHRFGVFVESLYRHHLPFRADRIVNVHRDEQIEVPAVVERIKGFIKDGVTAIVCAADHQAYELYDALTQAGIRIPEDISITGFDGETPQYNRPQLMTVQTPFREIGVSSVVSLMRRVTHPSAPSRHILVSGKVIEGKTVRPVKH